ncbi:MAG: glycosyltransferase [Acidobacteriales bacterium]|nr:glycosyltransferase [Terriglobales bacterium]
MIWWWLWGYIEVAVWTWYVAQALIGLKQVPDLTEPEWDLTPKEWNSLPTLSVVVPARNEEEKIESCLRSLVRSLYPRLRVIAVDDRSTDATGAIMDRLKLEFPTRLSVTHVSELPEGWLGKTHAMWLGAQTTDTEYILFTDGDVVFAPKALARALAYMKAIEADHLVLFPTLTLRTFGETMMVSLFQTLFIFEHRAWKAADPKSKDHIGVGAFNLVRRDAYQKIGTYEALRLAILDDMKLGQRVKQAGLKQRVAYGRDLVRVRWAEGALGVIRGLTKNAFAVADFSVPKLLFQITGMTYILLGPYAGALLAPALAKLPFLLAIATIWAQYFGLARNGDTKWWYMVTHPLAAALFIYTMLRSTVVTLARGGIEWRGTRYSLAEIRASQD